jgi:hypothetical protein
MDGWPEVRSGPAVYLGDLTMFSKFVLYAGRIGWAIILLAIFAVILMALVTSAAR